MTLWQDNKITYFVKKIKLQAQEKIWQKASEQKWLASKMMQKRNIDNAWLNDGKTLCKVIIEVKVYYE